MDLEKLDLEEIVFNLMNREKAALENWATNRDRVISDLPEFSEEDIDRLIQTVAKYVELCGYSHYTTMNCFVLGVELGREVERRV